MSRAVEETALGRVLLHQQEGKLPLITFKRRDGTEAWRVQRWTGNFRFQGQGGKWDLKAGLAKSLPPSLLNRV